MRVGIIPVYNEGATILEVLGQAVPFLDALILINDGSNDNSLSLVMDWASSAPIPVDILHCSRNLGMAKALGEGHTHAKELMDRDFLKSDDIIINLDADGQHDPSLIPDLCRYLEHHQKDMVLAKRDFFLYPFFKKLGNAVMSRLGSFAAGHRYRDIESGLRLMRAYCLDDLERFYTGLGYSCAQEIAVILARRGRRVDNSYQVPVRYYRSRTRIADAALNFLMGWVACLRCVGGWPQSRARRRRSVCLKKTIAADFSVQALQEA